MENINISKVYFDGFKTCGFVKTSEFSQWVTVSGKLTERDFTLWALPAISARWAELTGMELTGIEVTNESSR